MGADDDGNIIGKRKVWRNEQKDDKSLGKPKPDSKKQSGTVRVHSYNTVEWSV